jgi:hypothetical protein
MHHAYKYHIHLDDVFVKGFLARLFDDQREGNAIACIGSREHAHSIVVILK